MKRREIVCPDLASWFLDYNVRLLEVRAHRGKSIWIFEDRDDLDSLIAEFPNSQTARVLGHRKRLISAGKAAQSQG